MGTETRRLSVRVSKEQRAFLEQRCAEIGCDVSELVRRALNQFDGTNNSESAGSASLQQPVLSNTPGHMVDSPDAVLTTLTVARATEVVEPKRKSALQAVTATSYPAKLIELLPQFRAFGMALRPERRNLFHRLVAAAQVAAESGDNPRDAELFMELLRLGNAYGQL